MKVLATTIAIALLALIPATPVSATGTNGTSLGACIDPGRDWVEMDPRPEHHGFRGGVKVYARDGQRGADRVICGYTSLQYDYAGSGSDTVVYIPANDPRSGEVEDYGLNGRYAMPWTTPGDVGRRHPYLDIWGRMGKTPKGRGIESFRVVVAPGCKMSVTFWGGKDDDIVRAYRFDNRGGSKPIWKKGEIPERYWGLKAVKWVWRNVWNGYGYVLMKVRVEVMGWVPADDKVSGISIRTTCPKDKGDTDDYVWGEDDWRLKR